MPKYITVKTEFGNEEAILFPDVVTHREIANGMHPLGAGFVDINVEYEDKGKFKIKLRVYGRSESLRMENRGVQDENIIHRTLLCLLF